MNSIKYLRRVLISGYVLVCKIQKNIRTTWLIKYYALFHKYWYQLKELRMKMIRAIQREWNGKTAMRIESDGSSCNNVCVQKFTYPKHIRRNHKLSQMSEVIYAMPQYPKDSEMLFGFRCRHFVRMRNSCLDTVCVYWMCAPLFYIMQWRFLPFVVLHKILSRFICIYIYISVFRFWSIFFSEFN